MAKRKITEAKWRWVHGGVYTLCMAFVLFIGVQFSWPLLLLLLAASLAHLAIDAVKKFIPKKRFTVDQLSHLVTLVLFWRLWGECLQVRVSIFWEFEALSTSAISVVSGLLYIVKPVGELIEHGDIWDFNKGKNLDALEDYVQENARSASKMIGYLERIIVFILLLNGQFAAIAVVFAAKPVTMTVARFADIENSGTTAARAEFYIIGTLLSMISVFAVAFLLGLI